MKFGMRWLLRPPWSTAPSPPVAAALSPASSRGRERLIVAGLALLASSLIFLIYYRFPEMPYLLLAILVSSFWKIRAGIVCLVLAEGILLRAVLRESPPPWFDGFEDALRLALLGLVGMGGRALLNGLERQRHTEQQLIAELSTTVEQLREAQDQLIRAERLAALGQFSATMAHELRNPLNVVKLSARYVAGHLTDTDEKLQRNLSHMNQYVDRACAIIDDLLAFSRLPPPQLRPVPINELVREAVLALSVPEGVTVDWALAPDLPAVLADAGQIDQAVSNLGINAVQAMPDGGRLTVTTRREEDRIEITLGDNGPGIASELWEKVFEPFFSTKASGTGLGLPLVREIATAHGGQVSFQSAPGEGACFTLSLPVRRSADGGQLSAAAPHSSSPPREPDGEEHATGSSAA